LAVVYGERTHIGIALPSVLVAVVVCGLLATSTRAEHTADMHAHAQNESVATVADMPVMDCMVDDCDDCSSSESRAAIRDHCPDCFMQIPATQEQIQSERRDSRPTVVRSTAVIESDHVTFVTGSDRSPSPLTHPDSSLILRL
jgi:hypothetical protein